MMADYTSVLENGAAVDAELIKVRDSNLNPAHKITRGATVVVAASDSSKESRDQADYVCDGVADNVELQAALDSLPDIGGEILLMEGGYQLAATVARAIDNVTWSGFGASTKIEYNHSDYIFSVGVQKNWAFADMLIDYGYISLQDATNWSLQNIWYKTERSIIRYIDSFSDSSFAQSSEKNIKGEMYTHPLVQPFCDFETDGEWTIGATGSLEYDYSIKLTRTRSMKVSVPAGGSSYI